MRNIFMAVKKFLPLAVLAGLGITLQSCEEMPTTTATGGVAKIEGKVVDKSTSTPIEKVVVKALPYNRSVETDASGKYTLSIELPDTLSATTKLVLHKEGFVKDSLMAVIIKNNHQTTAPEVKLSRTGGNTGEGSGDATNIVLVDITSTTISVKGSGGQATSKMTFEVRDGQGIPVDVQHQVKVNFNMRNGPGGGEILTPTSMDTDANGRVFTTLTSGLKAGALQVIATFFDKQTPPQPISGAPVPIAIHGGLPDQNHFSIAMEKLNFAGLIYYGLENRITAYVGDQYSNPVQPNTKVYFKTTGGIIEGSAITDALGRATVVLTSSRPAPPGPPASFATITAETFDEKNVKILATGKVLFSGSTQPIEMDPLLPPTPSFTIAPFSSQSFTYKVRDENDNPLVAGTTISVSTDAGTVAGSTNITLKDTQSRAFTKFTFTLKNAAPDSVDKEATVKIEVTSQNGDASTSFTGRLLKKR